MAIADIFRPKHKHSKSSVRAAAVAAMDKGDIDLLVDVASNDDDLSIRRSAVSKIDDADLLVQVMKQQDDAKLREHLTTLVVQMSIGGAVSSTDLADAKIAFNRAAAMGGDRALAKIAGEAQLAEIRAQALARLEDERALAQVVRKSQRAEQWQEALARISDDEILRGIATDEKRKEVAFAALEGITDVDTLDDIAAKAKSKPVRAKAKRLRAALDKSGETVPTVSDDQKRENAERAQLVRTVQKLAGEDEWIQSRITVDQCRARWDELEASADAELIKRFAKAWARYEKAFDLNGKAAANAVAKEQARIAAQEAAAQAALVEAAKPVPPVAEAKVEEPVSVEAPPAIASEQSTKAADEQDARLDNQDELERLCEALEELSDTDNMRGYDKTLKDTDRLRRKIGSLPKDSSEALRERYEEARRKAVIRLGELREADDWKRWASVPKMEALVTRAKELLADTEATKVGDALKILQKEWRELGAAPRAKGDELWKVFKTTCDEVYERVKAEREVRNEEQAANLVEKEALCVRAEELQSSTDWQETGVLYRELQAQWKTIGPVPRRKSDGLWKRFRGACDAFFEARKPHLEEQQSELEDNLEAKQALIKEIEELAAAEGEAEEHIDLVRSMQRRWREIGKVAHRAYEEVNSAYKIACDKVYDKRTLAEEAELLAKRILITDMEAQIVECADAGWDSDAADVAKKVLDIRSRYLQMDKAIEGYPELGTKVDSLIRSQLESEAAAYEGSVLDVERSKSAYEALIAEALELVPEAEEESAEENPEEMAEKLRAALADRALGGVLSKDAVQSPGIRVEELRGQWLLIGPVPGAPGTELNERFEAGCQLVLANAVPEQSVQSAEE